MHRNEHSSTRLQDSALQLSQQLGFERRSQSLERGFHWTISTDGMRGNLQVIFSMVSSPQTVRATYSKRQIAWVEAAGCGHAAMRPYQDADPLLRGDARAQPGAEKQQLGRVSSRVEYHVRMLFRSHTMRWIRRHVDRMYLDKQFTENR